MPPSLVTRRTFLSATPILAASASAPPATAAGRLTSRSTTDAVAEAPAQQATTVPPRFPSQEPAVVKEMVTVAHFDLARVKALLTRQPALARASWDWGFGDWESALGAASHVGNRDIAELLLAHGARPSLFSAAMLGQLEVVRAFVAAAPGIQATKGPHSLTLLAHARAGGERAKPVVEYLESVGGADPRLELQPLTDAQMARLVGTYGFGPATDDTIDITRNQRSPGALMFTRKGGDSRGLAHVGGLAFSPAGADAVRVRFVVEGDRTTLTVHDPDVVVTGSRRF